MSKLKLENIVIASHNESSYVALGKIYDDDRFANGTEVHTSKIKFIDFEKGILQTKNTKYELISEIPNMKEKATCPYFLPYSSLSDDITFCSSDCDYMLCKRNMKFNKNLPRIHSVSALKGAD